MAWQQWVLIALHGTGGVLSVMNVGKPREPLTPGVAAGVAATQGALIWMVTTL